MFDRHATISTAIGNITLVASGDALIGVYFPHHWVGADRALRGSEVEIDTDPVLAPATTELTQYLAGERRDFAVLTAAEGDKFQRRVWAALDEIPYGGTTTYGAIAEQLGDKSLARVVGKAVGSNPLSIIVPCHRVVGSNGKLTGYAGGIERKQWLLQLEGAQLVQANRLF